MVILAILGLIKAKNRLIVDRRLITRGWSYA